MASPIAAAATTRWRVRKTAITESTAIEKPMQLRMSTLSRSVHAAGKPERNICARKAKARKNRYPERRNAAKTRWPGVRPRRSLESIRNASVTPVRNRKMAGGMPPANCESTHVLPGRSSGLRNESNTCPCSMMMAPSPRSQSRYSSRYVLVLVFMPVMANAYLFRMSL